MSTLLLDQRIEIPTIRTLSDFRRWIRSEAFPPRGRIDYVNGCVEVDMSPEDAAMPEGTGRTVSSSRRADLTAR